MLGVLMFVFVAGFSMHEGVQGLVREHKEFSSTGNTVEAVDVAPVSEVHMVV